MLSTIVKSARWMGVLPLSLCSFIVWVFIFHYFWLLPVADRWFGPFLMRFGWIIGDWVASGVAVEVARRVAPKGKAIAGFCVALLICLLHGVQTSILLFSPKELYPWWTAVLADIGSLVMVAALCCILFKEEHWDDQLAQVSSPLSWKTFARWCGLLPAAIIGFSLGHFAFYVPYHGLEHVILLWHADAWLRVLKSTELVAGEWLGALGFIWLGALLAPRYKLQCALILALVWATGSGLIAGGYWLHPDNEYPVLWEVPANLTTLTLIVLLITRIWHRSHREPRGHVLNT